MSGIGEGKVSTKGGLLATTAWGPAARAVSLKLPGVLQLGVFWCVQVLPVFSDSLTVTL